MTAKPPTNHRPMPEVDALPKTGSTVCVVMLAIDSGGETVFVKINVPNLHNDGDYSVEVGSASREVTSLGYTVLGSFLDTDSVAELVNLEKCQEVAWGLNGQPR